MVVQPKERKNVSPKLSRNWEGPYTVMKPINDRIQPGPRTKPKVVHWNRLWRYSGDNPPKWLEQTSAQAETQSQASPGEGLNENSEPTRSVENGGLCRSTRTRKPPSYYSPNN